MPDADVVSITDPEANGPSSTQPEEETQAAKLVDVKQALDEVSDRTLDPELASAAAATAMQTTTPALKRVRDTAPSGQRALSDEKTVLAPRRPASRAPAPPPARPVGVWVVLLTTALGLGALVAWLVTR